MNDRFGVSRTAFGANARQAGTKVDRGRRLLMITDAQRRASVPLLSIAPSFASNPKIG